MSPKSIEKLVILVLSAYAVKFFGSQFIYLYFSNSVNQLQADGISELANFSKASIYQKHANEILSMALNIVLAYWLYCVSLGKKVAWCALGLFAGWWALPIYAYYIYISDESHSS